MAIDLDVVRARIQTAVGHTWDLWVESNVTWGPWQRVVTYRRTSNTNSVTNFDLKTLYFDAASRGYIRWDWFLTGVEAGFEIWDDGAGLSIQAFDAETEDGGGGGLGGRTFRLKSVHNGALCADVAYASTSNRANVMLHTCHLGSNQRWRFDYRGDDVYGLVAQHSSRCLDVAYNSQANAGNVWQYGCNLSSAQRWYVENVGDWKYRLRHDGTDLCLAAAGNTAGANLEQRWCDDSTQQQFWLEEL